MSSDYYHRITFKWDPKGPIGKTSGGVRVFPDRSWQPGPELGKQYVCSVRFHPSGRYGWAVDAGDPWKSHRETCKAMHELHGQAVSGCNKILNEILDSPLPNLDIHEKGNNDDYEAHMSPESAQRWKQYKDEAQSLHDSRVAEYLKSIGYWDKLKEAKRVGEEAMKMGADTNWMHPPATVPGEINQKKLQEYLDNRLHTEFFGRGWLYIPSWRIRGII